MNSIIFNWILCCFLFIPVSQGQTNEMQRTSSCQIRELSNRNGWKIPGLSKTLIKVAHARYTGEDTENIFVDILESKEAESSATLISVNRDVPDRLEVSDRPVEVNEIWQFAMNDRIFSYLVSVTIVGFDQHGQKIHAASEEHLYYYDPDGSGKFTVMRYAGEMFFKPIVPEWVKHDQITRAHINKR